MSQTLDAIRERFPQYKDVPDAELAPAIHARFPIYAEQDKDFAGEVAQARGIQPPKGMVEQTIVSPGEPTALVPGAPNARAAVVEGPPLFRTVLTADPRIPKDPLTGLPAEMTPVGPDSEALRRQAILEMYPELTARDTTEFGKIFANHVLSGSLAKPVVDAVTSYTGNVARGAVADLAGAASGGRAELTDPRSNIAAALKGETRLPIDQAIADAESVGGNVSSVVGQISSGLSASLPMLLGMSKLPVPVQQTIGRAFVAKMVMDQAEAAKALYGELQKPEGERDQSRINELVAASAQNLGFLGLAAYAGFKGKSEIRNPKSETNLPNAGGQTTEVGRSAEPALPEQRSASPATNLADVQTSGPKGVVNEQPVENADAVEVGAQRAGDAQSAGLSQSVGPAVDAGRGGASEGNVAPAVRGEQAVPAVDEVGGTTTAVLGVPSREIPLKELKLSKEVPNFKENADESTGVVSGNELGGKYERVGTAPIVVWERLNGDKEVITGRHRLDLAKRTGEKTIPAQVLREADGFTKDKALTFDAEANIRDGQGSVKDYAHYFRNSSQRLTYEEAKARGLLSRPKGKAGFDLGQHAGDDLFALYAADKISEAQALSIVRAAPGDPAVQQLGIKLALDGKPSDFIRARLERERAATESPVQTDMFGNPVFSESKADAEAKQVVQIRKDIAEQLAAVRGAAKRPEAARKLGVDVKDPEALKQKIAELEGELERWDGQWWLQPDLVARLKGEPVVSGKPDLQLAKPESVQEQAARAAAEQAVAEKKAQQDEIARRAAEPISGKGVDTTGDMFDANKADAPLFASKPKEFGMAAPGGGGGGRSNQVRRGIAATSPAAPTVVPHSPGTKPAGVGVIGTIGQHLANARLFLQSLVSPQNIDESAKLFSLVLRENNGRSAADMIKAEEAMNVFRRQFDRTPVDLKSYTYDPRQPLPHNFQVMDAFERNRAALPPDLQRLGQVFDNEFAWRIAEIQRFKPELLKNLIADYFPHIWESPDGTAVREFMAEVAARAPLQGNKAFLKQRSISFFADGLARGLKPIHDNPVDLLMAKMHQMDKFIMALRTIEESKDRGWMQWLPIGQRMPEGYRIVDDPAFTVHLPPYLEVREAFDAGIRLGLVNFMAKMGFRYERVASLKVKGLMNAWGVYISGGDIKSRFGSPDFVIMHEIGHGLDERYGLFKVLAATKPMAAELKGLADLRVEPGKTVPAKFRQYLHMPEEQVANAVHAYIYAPELMEQKAPTVKRAMEVFIGAHPELQDLNTIKPSLAIASGKMKLPTAGPILAGHWIMRDGPAQVLSNHLSPGLSQWSPYRTLRAGSNILNAAQLGLSGFHLGFTSLDAMFSTLGTAITEAARGNLVRGGKMAAQSVVAPVRNYYAGKRVQQEMISPGSTGNRAAAAIAELAVRAGLRATVDPFWKTEVTRNLVRAWHRGTPGGVAESMFRFPFAVIEQSMRPIAEYVVPRQKLGVFATIAESEARKLGPGATTDEIRMAMARAADMTENRMGQMTYDNLFYNRMVKDAALVAFRAYGWQLGKYRELAGVLGDSARFVKDIAMVATDTTRLAAKGQLKGAKLRAPEFTNRMGYAAALVAGSAVVGGIMHYLLSGRAPQTAMDYFHPSLGRKDDNGNEVRLSLPTYLKDLESDAKYMSRGWEDGGALGLAKGLWNSSYHRLNPAASFAVDMMNNRDFFGTEIWSPNDPWTAKALDQAKFVAKQFTPFSIIGAKKVKDDSGGPLEWALPFVGVVPAKKALTMTPAEAKAAEFMQASMPAAARTKDQAAHSQLVKDLVRDFRNGKLNGQGELVARVQGTGIAVPTKTPADKTKLTQLEQRMLWTPLQYQVNKMPLKNAMEVFDLASDEEKVTLAPFVFRKTTNAMKNIDTETASRYAKIIVPWYQKALAARQGK